MSIAARLCAIAFLIAQTSALAADPAASASAHNAAATYTIEFPNDAPVAEILVSSPGPPGPLNRKTRILAQGKVTLPKTCALEIKLCYAGTTHMETLEQIDVHQLKVFSAQKLEVEDSQLAHLKKFRELISLDLDSTLVSDKSLPLIGSFSKLFSLHLNSTDITGSGFDALSNLHNLSSISLEGIALKPGALAKLKTHAGTLTGLDVSKSGLTDADMAAIGDLHNLTHLDISGNKLVNDNGVKYLQSLTNLSALRINDTSITEKSLPIINKLPQLHYVVVRNSQFWICGRPQNTKSRIKFSDAASLNKAPLDIFGPLH